MFVVFVFGLSLLSLSCLSLLLYTGILEHLDNDPHVQLGAHVDRVEQHHDHHDKGAELVPERVVHDDEDGGGDPRLVPGVDPKGDIVEADHIPTHPKRLCPPRACKVPGLGDPLFILSSLAGKY